MANTYTWGIANLERNLSDGKVTVVHWTVSARSANDAYSASAYGSIGLDGEVTTPFADLQEEQVIGWVQSHFGEEKVEEILAALDGQIQAQQEPVTGSGLLPWAA